MYFTGDYHMHTLFSDGRGTVEEMVIGAKLRGLEEIGIADHGPRNMGAGVKDEGVFLEIKEELAQLKLHYPELKLLVGSEANVLNGDGILDLSKNIIKELDYLIVGLHPFVWPAGIKGIDWLLENQLTKVVGFLQRRVINLNTKALVSVIHDHDVWAVSHPGLKMEIDVPEVARACISEGTAWEINTGHRHPTLDSVLEAARLGVDFVVNSDAHYPDSVGSLDYGSWVLEKAGVPVDRVLNAKHEN